MLYSSLVLGLVAAVSAVDIRFYSNNQGACYSGPWISCPNANPNLCCTATGRFYATVGIVAVPGDWTLTANGYRGAGCESWQQAAIGRGRDFCLGATGYSMSGSYYWFGDGKKRAVNEKCEGTERASQLGLEDGSIYDISDLSDDDVEEMVCSIRPTETTIANEAHVALASDGTATENLPHLAQLRRLK
ncbi:hypothetical protein FHETE_6392 [Fusarium heterosporum]|uniref:Uncharacterized protein n=1 Tax=Fusarium heterosporum TaxID=42747 RepID=A0A8H5WN91_FUSHE|nr:hypothetical protein FHETE_6392 [Fusarium heterosporum]